MRDSVLGDTRFYKPFPDFLLSLLGWTECVNDLFGCPMLAKIGRRWIRATYLFSDFIQLNSL